MDLQMDLIQACSTTDGTFAVEVEDPLISQVTFQVDKEDLNELTDSPTILQASASSSETTSKEVKQITDEITHLNKGLFTFQPNLFEDLQLLCDLLDVPLIQATGEADALCGKLYQTGQVQAIMSEDSDILLYGGGRLVRKFNYSETLELLDLNLILQSLGITLDQLIDLCLLCGTDYTKETIEGLGPVGALCLIQKGLTIEQIIDEIQRGKLGHRYHMPDESTFTYKEARSLIKTAHEIEPAIEIAPFDLTHVDFPRLSQLMKEKCRYRPDTMTKHYEQLKTTYEPPRPKIKIVLKKTFF